jgi:iron complex outermembrane receptor protein
VLAGYSDLFQQTYTTSGGSNGTNYKRPNDLNPIVYGVQGDGSADVAEDTNVDTETKNWDSAYYLNYYGKFLNDRVILMSGIRRDINTSWDDDLTTTTGGVESASLANKTYQNGIMVEVTRSLSLYALKAEGVEPNFQGLKNAATGAPVSANTGKSNEYGIKFDFFKGKLTGTVSRYTITKTSWVSEPWFAPAPLGHPRFNPNNPTVYNLSDEDNPGQGMMPNNAVVGGITWPAASDGPLSGTALTQNLAAGGNGLNGANNTGAAVTAFKAAVNAGAIYVSSAGIGTPQVYINASTSQGAAYLDAVFAGNNGGQNGGWPGWMYAGMDIAPYGPGSHDDKLLNNGTQDAAGFLNTGQGAALQVVDQSKGYEGQVMYTPNDQIQVVFNASVHATVNRINNGSWPDYPYTANDRWEPWFFANFGLNEQPLTGAGGAYSDPTNTSTPRRQRLPGRRHAQVRLQHLRELQVRQRAEGPDGRRRRDMALPGGILLGRHPRLRPGRDQRRRPADHRLRPVPVQPGRLRQVRMEEVGLRPVPPGERLQPGQQQPALRPHLQRWDLGQGHVRDSLLGPGVQPG